MSDALESSASESNPAACRATGSEVRRPLVLVGIWTLCGAILGTAAGGLIGAYAPTYYLWTFRAWDFEAFDPIQAGVALGVLQGGGVGLAIGVGLIVLTAWWRSSSTQPTEEWPWPTQSVSGRWVPVIVIGAIFGVLAGVLGFVVGTITGHESIYRNRAEEEISLVRELINDDPRYSQIELSRASNGHVGISGRVPDASAADDLHAGLEKTFGVLRAEGMLANVYTSESGN